MKSELICRLRILLAKIHVVVGRSAVGTKLAVKLRNQANAVIRAHLNDGIFMSSNGESWLIDQIAPRASFFIDVGANTGSWSILFIDRMQLGGKGLLFEPSPVAAKISAQNLAKDGKLNSVEVVQSAVGDRLGIALFYMEKNAGETSSLIAEHSRKDAETIEVPVTTIDGVLEERGIQFVDFLKVDAEGFDLQVMKGAMGAIAAHRIGIIQFEYNAPWALTGSTLADALNLLRNNGYVVYLLKRGGLYTFNYEFLGEFFGYSNFVAIFPEYWPTYRESVAGAV